MANHSEMLTQVFCEVLENFAFMFGDPVEPDELPPLDEGFIDVRMSFTGKVNGSLMLATTPAMAAEVAANVLGLEPDEEGVEERSQDALKEVLNVTCGHVVSALAGEHEAFDLSPPKASKIDLEDWQAALDEGDVATLLVEDSPALLRVVLTDSAD